MSSKQSKSDSQGETATTEDVDVEKPRQYRVFLINDDYTTMEFVISVLETIFLKTPSEATQIMLAVHRQGRGVCGVYARQIAEAKVALVLERARNEGHPLQCTMEETD